MQKLRSVSHSFRNLSVVSIFIAFSLISAAQAGGHKSAAAGPGDIVDVAVSNGSFNTLVAAATAADLAGALKGDGPLTLFAPTDEAFAALPEGTVENLLKPENLDQLKAVLLYHVVSGKVTSDDLAGTINADTLQGSSIEIVKASGWTKKQRTITVNGANVIGADVDASNGVIHVIDTVLMPPQA